LDLNLGVPDLTIKIPYIQVQRARLPHKGGGCGRMKKRKNASYVREINIIKSGVSGWAKKNERKKKKHIYTYLLTNINGEKGGKTKEGNTTYWVQLNKFEFG
jgi:hypothetical protein